MQHDISHINNQDDRQLIHKEAEKSEGNITETNYNDHNNSGSVDQGGLVLRLPLYLHVHATPASMFMSALLAATTMTCSDRLGKECLGTFLKL